MKDKREIMRDPFFSEIDWDLLRQKKLEPPILLRIEDEEMGDELELNFLVRSFYRVRALGVEQCPREDRFPRPGLQRVEQEPQPAEEVFVCTTSTQITLELNNSENPFNTQSS